MKYFLFIVFFQWSILAFSQDDRPLYAIKNIAEELKENSCAVIREHQTTVEIIKPGKAHVSERLVISILNREGDFYNSLIDGYDRFSKILSMEGFLYDANGKLIGRVKNKDVIDRSYTTESNFADDIRIKVLELNGIPIPCTVEFREEKTINGYITLPEWRAMNTFNTSLERASYIVKHPVTVDVTYRSKNIDASSLKKSVVLDQEFLTWSIDHIPAFQKESYAPDKLTMLPTVSATSISFEVDDFQGSLENWRTFGKFIYDLNKGKDQFKKEKFPRDLYSDASATKKETAKKLYEYLQNNTRYVSIQLGIGGWQSFESDFVNKNKIGDCKALTTYMKALLKEAGISSYQVLVNAGGGGETVIPEFPFNYFNHVVLMVPFEGDTTWLECTSHYNSFGYLGSFTEGHTGLILSDTTSSLIQLPSSLAGDNLISIWTNVTMDKDLNASAKMKITASNTMQDELKFLNHQGKSDEIRQWVLNLFRKDIKKIDSIHVEEFSLQKPSANLTCLLNLPHLLSKAGKDYVLEVNSFTGLKKIPENSFQRKFPVYNENAFLIRDSTVYHLPYGFTTAIGKNDSIVINSDFGNYRSFLRYFKDENRVEYFREFRLNKFNFPAERYNELRNFITSVYNSDKQMIVISEQ